MIEQSIIAKRDLRTQSIVNSATINVRIVRHLILSKSSSAKLKEKFSEEKMKIAKETTTQWKIVESQKMTFKLSNLNISESKQIEPAMVSDLHRLKLKGWRFEIWGGPSRFENATSRDDGGDPGGDHLVAGAHRQPALHPQHPDLGQGQDDPVQVQPLLPVLQQWWEITLEFFRLKSNASGVQN